MLRNLGFLSKARGTVAGWDMPSPGKSWCPRRNSWAISSTSDAGQLFVKIFCTCAKVTKWSFRKSEGTTHIMFWDEIWPGFSVLSFGLQYMVSYINTCQSSGCVVPGSTFPCGRIFAMLSMMRWPPSFRVFLLFHCLFFAQTKITSVWSRHVWKPLGAGSCKKRWIALSLVPLRGGIPVLPFTAFEQKRSKRWCLTCCDVMCVIAKKVLASWYFVHVFSVFLHGSVFLMAPRKLLERIKVMILRAQRTEGARVQSALVSCVMPNQGGKWGCSESSSNLDNSEF